MKDAHKQDIKVFTNSEVTNYETETPKSHRFGRIINISITSIQPPRIVKELKQKAQNNKITISKLTRSILYEYLKDTEKLTSLLKINEPKRTLIISSVNPNTVKKIEEIAINCGITKAEIVRKILLDYLKNETPNDQIEEQKQ